MGWVHVEQEGSHRPLRPCHSSASAPGRPGFAKKAWPVPARGRGGLRLEGVAEGLATPLPTRHQPPALAGPSRCAGWKGH